MCKRGHFCNIPDHKGFAILLLSVTALTHRESIGFVLHCPSIHVFTGTHTQKVFDKIVTSLRKLQWHYFYLNRSSKVQQIAPNNPAQKSICLSRRSFLLLQGFSLTFYSNQFNLIFQQRSSIAFVGRYIYIEGEYGSFLFFRRFPARRYVASNGSLYLSDTFERRRSRQMLSRAFCFCLCKNKCIN